MTRRAARALGALALLSVAALSISLILLALKDNIVFFYSPSEVAQRAIADRRPFRLGGLVKEGSLRKTGARVQFVVTDGVKDLPVDFTGALPDLFREKQGVVCEGTLRGGVFFAQLVLAKHDENYMPREVADKIKKDGHWQGRVQSGGVK